MKNVPALAKVLTKAAGTLDDAVKPIKNTVDNITSKAKQTAASAIQNAKHLGNQHANQPQYMLKHPIVVAAVTSKSGEASIRKSAKFIDEALRPTHVRTVQTTAGDTIGTGIERGENKGTFSKRVDEFIAKIQAEKEIHLIIASIDLKYKSLLKEPTCRADGFSKYGIARSSYEYGIPFFGIVVKFSPPIAPILSHCSGNGLYLLMGCIDFSTNPILGGQS